MKQSYINPHSCYTLTPIHTSFKISRKVKQQLASNTVEKHHIKIKTQLVNPFMVGFVVIHSHVSSRFSRIAEHREGKCKDRDVIGTVVGVGVHRSAGPARHLLLFFRGRQGVVSADHSSTHLPTLLADYIRRVEQLTSSK